MSTLSVHICDCVHMRGCACACVWACVRAAGMGMCGSGESLHCTPEINTTCYVN